MTLAKNSGKYRQQAYRVEAKIGQTLGIIQPIGLGKLPNYPKEMRFIAVQSFRWEEIKEVVLG
jgi:hypothetical protein